MRRIALLPLALLFAAASAQAAEPIKPASERTITAGPSVRPQPGTARSTGPGSRPAIRGPKIPDALRERMRVQLEARVNRDFDQIRTLRVQAINLLQTFVNETPREAREMPEALMRLGELKWELEREAFLDRFKKWESMPPDQRGPTPEPNLQPTRELFARVLNDYPWFPDYDLALYVDGFMATEQGKTEEAMARFQRILTDFPSSRFVPDAHMAKAEAIFNSKYDYAAALAEYEEVLKFKNSDLYGLALFKSAWCYWRLGNNEEAARRFVSVFEVTDAQGRVVTAQQRKQLDELQGEALKYLVEVFTENEKNTAADLFAFLQRIGGDRFSGKIVRALAETFYDQGHFDRGIEAYELLLRLEPTSPQAGDWVLRIAQGYSAQEDYPKLTATYQRALAGYTPGSPWARAQADQANVAAVSGKLEAQLRQDATNVHAKAQQDKTSRAEFEAATALYNVYLTKFENDPNGYVVHFRIAEIDFFRLEKYQDAATHYLAAAKLMPKDKNDPDSQAMRHDAIYNALSALQHVRVTELEANRGKPYKGETESDKKFAEALDLYAQLYPNDPKLPEIFFDNGLVYYEYGAFDSSVKIWGTLLEKFPNSPFEQKAGEGILDALNKAQDFETIETWARRLKKAPAFQAQAQQAKLDNFIVQAVFKQGEQKAAAGDHAKAAAAYLRAAKEFPNDERAAKACVNAELEAQKAGDVQTLKDSAALAMSPAYAQRPESPQGAWIAATTLQSMGLFAEAADFDEKALDLSDASHPNYQKFEHTKDAAYDAVVLREAIGEHDRAVVDGQKFLRTYSGTPEADEVVFQMGRAHQNANRPRDAADLYKQFLGRTTNQDKRAQGFVLLALADEKLGDEPGVDQSLAQAVSIGKTHAAALGPDGRYAAARARYMQGERVLKKYEAIQIEGDIEHLGQRIKQKVELLKQSSDIFLDCVQMKVAEWATASLYQVGTAYEQFSQGLKATQPPASLSQDQQEAFRAQLEEYEVPMESKAIDAYESGWKKAIELGIFNSWTAKLREALGRVNSVQYPPFKEIGFQVRSTAPMPMPALIDAPRGRGTAPAAPPAPKAAGK